MLDGPQVLQILLESGIVTAAQVERTVEKELKFVNRTLGEGYKRAEFELRVVHLLRQHKIVTEEEVARTVASHVGMDYIDLPRISIAEKVIQMLPEDTARRFEAVPVRFSQRRLVIAISNPLHPKAREWLPRIVPFDLEFVCATPDAIHAAQGWYDCLISRGFHNCVLCGRRGYKPSVLALNYGRTPERQTILENFVRRFERLEFEEINEYRCCAKCTSAHWQKVAAEEQAAQVVAREATMEYIDLDGITIPGEVIKMMPERIAEEFGVVPVRVSEDNQLVIAISDPLDLDTCDSLRHLLPFDLEFVCASRGAIDSVHKAAGWYKCYSIVDIPRAEDLDLDEY